MKFIQLTDLRGFSVYINPLAIAAIHLNESGVTISTVSGETNRNTR